MRNYLRAVASIFVLAVAVCAFASWTTVQKEFSKVKSQELAIEVLSKYEEAKDEDLADLISIYEESTKKSDKDSAFIDIKQFLSAKALSEQYSKAEGADAEARSIKKDPIYAAEKEVISSNWIQKLMDRLRNALKRDSSESQQEKSGPMLPWIGELIRVLFYIVCIAIVILLVFLLTKIPWLWGSSRKSKKKKSGGLLEDGELLLSEDEYLLQADQLISEGKFREACRALYLAALLRIDKSRVARFEPAQTNWEHLRRIEASKTRPENLEFRTATKAFDMAWYGYQAKSAADVQIFRETYVSVKNLTEGMI